MDQHIYISIDEANEFLYAVFGTKMSIHFSWIYTEKKQFMDMLRDSKLTPVEKHYKNYGKVYLFKTFISRKNIAPQNLIEDINSLDELEKRLEIRDDARELREKQRKEYMGKFEEENKMHNTKTGLLEWVRECIKENEDVLEDITIADDGSIDISRLKLYKDMPVRFQDNFMIKDSRQNGLSKSLILLYNSEEELTAAGRLIEKDRVFYGVFNNSDIDFTKIHSNENFKLVFFTPELNVETLYDYDFFSDVRCIKNCKVQYTIPQETDRVLCIDFGTSNTTAGSFGILDRSANEPELVKFYRQDTVTLDERFPTAVYVEDCSDSDNIKYLFGYDVNIRVRNKDYDIEASVFYEIKRWMSDPNCVEALHDENGNTCSVKRGDIIVAYLRRIIEETEYTFKTKFKKIHFSAPAKMKSSFLTTLTKLLPEYTILRAENETIDEGVAIVYNYISERKRNAEEKEEGKIIIIDCGGGTTDYAKCDYKIIPREENITLELTTQFENGNTNFGGNSITYRILQFLKIRIANRKNPNIVPVHEINSLIPYSEDEILTHIDKVKSGTEPENRIYGELEKLYVKASTIIPTSFAEHSFDAESKKIKRNYYYLWQIAEYIKTEFYKNGDKVGAAFSENKVSKNNIDMTKILSKYCLYIRENGEGDLIDEKTLPDIEVNLEEIRKLLYGDIYDVLNDLLYDFKLEEDVAIKLSGQSCRINIFNHLMREFVSGKQLRKAVSTYNRENASSLKLDCVKGCINFAIDRESNDIRPIINTNPPQLIYTVTVERRKPVALLSNSGGRAECRFSCYNVDTSSNAWVSVKDNKNNVERKIEYKFARQEQYKRVKDSELAAEFAKTLLTEEEAKKLVADIQETNTEEKIGDKDGLFLLALPSADRYGFVLYTVKRLTDKNDNTTLYIGPAESQNYESNIGTQRYFDGSR